MTNMAVLNDTTVRRARPRSAKYEITCKAVRGFVLRVLPSGRKVYLVRHRPAGRDVRVRIGEADTMSCDEARARAMEILAGGAPHTPPRSSARTVQRGAPAPETIEAPAIPTFAAFAERYDREHIARSLKPRTQERYRSQLQLHLLPAFGSMRLDRIKPADVEALHGSMREIPCSANNAVRVISHMFTKACDWEVLPRDHASPTRTVRMYQERKRERFLTPDERARLEEVLVRGESIAPGNQGAIRWATAAAIRLLALTGMRRNEVLGLQWSMVDTRHHRLRLPDSKTGQKAVPVSSHVIALLDQLRAYQRDDVPWVLYSRTGRRIHETSIAASWCTIREAAGLEGVRLHDLRHSAASDALMAGVPLEVVSKILGHSSTRTTARYAHLSDDVVQAAVESMGASIVSAQGTKPKPRRAKPRRAKPKRAKPKGRRTPTKPR